MEAGGEAWYLWSAWRYGGEDPYKLYNGPGAPVPPPHPSRLQALIYGFALYSQQQEVQLAGGKVGRR